MPKFSSKTLDAVSTLIESVDGAYACQIYRSDEYVPKGTMYIIEKRGLYYRPNNCGYTGLKSEAGIYPFEFADPLQRHYGGDDGSI